MEKLNVYAYIKAMKEELLNSLKKNDLTDDDFKYPIFSMWTKEKSELNHIISQLRIDDNYKSLGDISIELEGYSDFLNYITKENDNLNNDIGILLKDQKSQLNDIKRDLETEQFLSDDDDDDDDREIKFDEFDESLFESYLKKSRENK